MKYLDYLSFSQKSTTALRPTHSLFVTTLSPEITQNLQTFQMFFRLHTLHLIKIISIFVKLFQKKTR